MQLSQPLRLSASYHWAPAWFYVPDVRAQRCVLRIGFCQQHFVVLVSIVKHTQSMKQSISGFDYII